MSASDSLVDCLLTMGAALQVMNSSTAAAKSITICRVEEAISERVDSARKCFVGGLLV